MHKIGEWKDEFKASDKMASNAERIVPRWLQSEENRGNFSPNLERRLPRGLQIPREEKQDECQYVYKIKSGKITTKIER